MCSQVLHDPRISTPMCLVIKAHQAACGRSLMSRMYASGPGTCALIMSSRFDPRIMPIFALEIQNDTTTNSKIRTLPASQHRQVEGLIARTGVTVTSSSIMATALCNHALAAGLAGRCARPSKSRRSLRVSAVSAGQSGEGQVWLPGVDRPKHLEGKSAADGYPGNRGFDPLGLGRDEDRIKW